MSEVIMTPRQTLEGSMYPRGNDGISPEVKVTDIEGGHRVTITDKTGEHTADVMDGVSITHEWKGYFLCLTDKNGTSMVDLRGPAGGPGPKGLDGIDGIDGIDGFSPVVDVTDIDGGHRVTITDKKGAKTFDVMDGEKCDPGTIDWNDLENKPFYEEPGEVVLYPETTLQYSSIDPGFPMGEISPLVAGEFYNVTFNGTEYKCQLINDNDICFYLGNRSIALVGADTGEPFLIMFERVDFRTLTGKLMEKTWSLTECTVSITGDGMVVHPIEEKYLPKHLQFGEEVYEEFILPETSPAYDSVLMGFPIGDGYSLVNGEYYTVKYNGTEYKSQLRWNDSVSAFVLGNVAINDAGENTGEPFVILFTWDANLYLAGTLYEETRSATSCTVSISRKETVVKPIDEKYLPQKNTEQWVFELADGSTVTKDVVLL